jgi:gluconokinase
MNNYPLVWIIMGVASSGKTVVERLLSERLESDFLEGDRVMLLVDEGLRLVLSL